jgi:hypothetical protein
MRYIIRWSLTAAIHGADIWHLSDDLTLPEAILAARREKFPYVVQRRLLLDSDGEIVLNVGKSFVRVPGVELRPLMTHRWHAECLRCPGAAQFLTYRDAEGWRDIHEFENYTDGHLVRISLETDKQRIDMSEVEVVELE